MKKEHLDIINELQRIAEHLKKPKMEDDERVCAVQTLQEAIQKFFGKCENCGKVNIDGNFCSNCGTSLIDPEDEGEHESVDYLVGIQKIKGSFSLINVYTDKNRAVAYIQKQSLSGGAKLELYRRTIDREYF